MQLRKAIFDDWKMLLDWRNDPTTRLNSFEQGEVSEQTHKIWFNKSLSNSNREIYILEDNSIPVGSIRSDAVDSGKYILSWNIDPNQRGKGYGTKILEIYLQDKKGEFLAEIKPENIASIKMVQKNGFKQLNEIKYIKQLLTKI
jgi:RimJ/RimL family protein N-acetyltransferase